jgi:hypothetical protein
MSSVVPECLKCNRVFVPVQAGDSLCHECIVSPLGVPPRASRTRRRESLFLTRDEGVANMQRGGMVFVIGAVITFCTYAFADLTGGYFLLAWGAIIFGGIRFAYGVFQYFDPT